MFAEEWCGFIIVCSNSLFGKINLHCLCKLGDSGFARQMVDSVDVCISAPELQLWSCNTKI